MTLEEFLAEWRNDSPTLQVHTSGSTGTPKPILVDKQRMQVSARMTCGFLGLKPGDSALLCLPLDYIAGKMMVVRALCCDLQLVCVEPGGHPLASDDMPPLSFAAMVPLQVYNSLQVPQECLRLRSIGNLIIGGGAVDESLASQLRSFPHAVWSTYGMTETLSHIALRRLSGPQACEWYVPFEGVSLSLTPDQCLVVDAPAVCDRPLVTNDVAMLRPDGSFRILGRIDNVICSGGVKIQAEQVEALLMPRLPGVGICVTSIPDVRLGEALTLLVAGADATSLTALCRQQLPRYWQPRHILPVASLPLTPTGKIARAEARRMALQLFSEAGEK